MTPGRWQLLPVPRPFGKKKSASSQRRDAGNLTLPRCQEEPSGRKRSGTAVDSPDGPHCRIDRVSCTLRWRRPRRQARGRRGERALARPPLPSPWSGFSRSPTWQTWRLSTAGCVRRRCVGGGPVRRRDLRWGGPGRAGRGTPGVSAAPAPSGPLLWWQGERVPRCRGSRRPPDPLQRY